MNTDQMRFAIKVDSRQIDGDRQDAETRRNQTEWRRFRETGDMQPSPLGNWHFGLVVEQAIISVMLAFPESRRANLSWEGWKDAFSTVYTIQASAIFSPRWGR